MGVGGGMTMFLTVSDYRPQRRREVGAWGRRYKGPRATYLEAFRGSQIEEEKHQTE